MEQLMRLYNIIYEGFKIDVQLPTGIDATTRTYKEYTVLLAGKNIVYSDKDSPEDIIKIEPALTSNKLSEYIVLEPTRAFKNSKIYIGFTTSPAESGEDKFDDSIFTPMELQNQIGKLLAVNKEHIGETLNTNNMLRIANVLKSDEKSRDQRGKDGADPAAAERLIEAVKILGDVHELYCNTTESKEKDGRQTQLSNYTVPEAIAFLRRNVVKDYGKAASYEIAKQLKNPKNEAQLKITQEFTSLCLKQMAKLVVGSNASPKPPEPKRKNHPEGYPSGYKKTEEDIRFDLEKKLRKANPESQPQLMTSGKYQYIVYPESSSEFNRDLATAAAQMYGAETLQISKRSETDAPMEVDDEAIRSQAEDYLADNHWDISTSSYKFTPKVKGIIDTNGLPIKGGNKPRYFRTKEDFLKFWHKNTRDDVAANIKKAGNQIKIIQDPKRIYVKNLFPARDSYAVLSSKSVLLIDDNIVSSATVQMVKNLLMSINPQPLCVDIFIPLKVETNQSKGKKKKKRANT